MSMRRENGFIYWKKGSKELATYHFKLAEFECRCSECDNDEQKISIELVEKLESVRKLEDSPSILILSGYRCQAHQSYLRGLGYPTATGVSRHETGEAADITCATNKLSWLAQACAPLFGGMGTARTFLHVDTRQKYTRWTYPATAV